MENMTCDLCGEKLEKKGNFQVVCSFCGLLYTEERLQEKRSQVVATPPVVNHSAKLWDNAFDYPGTEQEYFAEVLRREFPLYDVHQNVRHPELTVPMDYVLCCGDAPMVAVFLVDRGNEKAQQQVEQATRFLESFGVPCVSFVKKSRNEVPYVVQRIQNALSK